MPELLYESPLKIPKGTAISGRAQKRYDSGFSPTLTIDEALRYLQEEVALLPEGSHATLYSNYDRIAVDRLRRQLADNSAVCLEVRLEGKVYPILSHQWGLTEQNIYGIHLGLRAVHNIVKWGLSDYSALLAAFSSQATEQPSAPVTSKSEEELIHRGQWLAILRLDETATLEDANAAYRYYAKKAAGSDEGLLRLNQAIEQARAYFTRRGA